MAGRVDERNIILAFINALFPTDVLYTHIFKMKDRISMAELREYQEEYIDLEEKQRDMESYLVAVANAKEVNASLLPRIANKIVSTSSSFYRWWWRWWCPNQSRGHLSSVFFIQCDIQTSESTRYVIIHVKKKIKEHVEIIKSRLSEMNDGEINISAYDTAWVALVEDIYGSGSPQFPTCLQWIIKNQLSDGSWGDQHIFSAHDRIISTLACVIALKAWSTCGYMREKGLLFIQQNMCKLEDANTVHMPVGFEVVFPSLIDIARSLDIDFPDEDSPALKDIYAKRKLKLMRIPKEVMHTVPTTLLHSLEGMANLDWEKLLKLQCVDGSFLFSPASTAFALMQTKNEKCLDYLQKAVKRFNGGVPNVYPVDMFERIWVVDRLDRLGISRYFQTEIRDCVDYVERYWTEHGVCWSRNSKVADIDDTALGFRILRLHGRDVSCDVFRHFKKGDDFYCFHGQSTSAVTGMFNLYRASQVMFPGENILQQAKHYSTTFLRKKQVSNELLDKWIITKDLPGEVGYALEVPWYASLPRIETRFYVEQYGGENDVWIGKTLYRMSNVNSNQYLELAKIDFNNCQALHQLECQEIQKWYNECKLEQFGVEKDTLLQSYFLATANIFSAERSAERLAWTQTAVLMKAVSSYFETIAIAEQKSFVSEFAKDIGCDNISMIRQKRMRSLTKKTTMNRDIKEGKQFGDNHFHEEQQQLIMALVSTLHHLSLGVLASHGTDVRDHLRSLWEIFLKQGYHEQKRQQEEAFVLVCTITLCAGQSAKLFDKNAISANTHLTRLVSLTNFLTHELLQINGEAKVDKEMVSIELGMQELVKCVHERFDGINPEIKQVFLMVVKSYYYVAFCSRETIDYHISKVLFERVA
ncbi:ent-copalyl diphosphate synthase, chloroplastic-like [Papaver somniferum]|uniref:ent-copalyl diphosphate synthase, chloroplastic-like n=1 Tax=Papaver somniferum TaxID=3469 RepID=UPI000E700158|nr:ent-copalyl diphosphate synthase, chloroplastic-like [Papaver somniferum]